MDTNNHPSDEGNKHHEKQTPRELAKKHLSDPSHEITEDEMKNLETNPEADPDLEKKENEKLDELKSEKGKQPLNPYDILDSE